MFLHYSTIQKKISNKIAISTALFFVTMIGTPLSGFADMNGPEIFEPRHKINRPVKVSSVSIVFDWGIHGFQKFLSPVDGARCDFYPTCSHFGRVAISQYGALQGIMMTGDRLMRCNQWKREDENYSRLKNGRLSDPVSKNVVVAD